MSHPNLITPHDRILALVRWLREMAMSSHADKTSYEVDLDSGTFSGHAYTIGDWHIVVAHKRKD